MLAALYTHKGFNIKFTKLKAPALALLGVVCAEFAAEGAWSSALTEGIGARLLIVQASLEMACGNSRTGMSRAELANDVLSQDARLTEEVNAARKKALGAAAGVLRGVRADYLSWLHGEALKERDHYLGELNDPSVPYAKLQADHQTLASDLQFEQYAQTAPLPKAWQDRATFETQTIMGDVKELALIGDRLDVAATRAYGCRATALGIKPRDGSGSGSGAAAAADSADGN